MRRQRGELVSPPKLARKGTIRANKRDNELAILRRNSIGIVPVHQSRGELIVVPASQRKNSDRTIDSHPLPNSVGSPLPNKDRLRLQKHIKISQAKPEFVGKKDEAHAKMFDHQC